MHTHVENAQYGCHWDRFRRHFFHVLTSGASKQARNGYAPFLKRTGEDRQLSILVRPLRMQLCNHVVITFQFQFRLDTRPVTGPYRRHMTFGWGVCRIQTGTAEFKLAGRSDYTVLPN